MHIDKFNQFISESYDFKEYIIPSSIPRTRIKYEFKNKEGLNFIVSFIPNNKLPGSSRFIPKSGTGGSYTREYVVDSDDDFFQEYFGETNSNDAIGIIKTVSDITIEFIKDYKPDSIEIDHIASRKEIEKYKLDPDFKKFKNVENQRARINRRYLEPIIPKNYKYDLKGSICIITKIA